MGNYSLGFVRTKSIDDHLWWAVCRRWRWGTVFRRNIAYPRASIRYKIRQSIDGWTAIIYRTRSARCNGSSRVSQQSWRHQSWPFECIVIIQCRESLRWVWRDSSCWSILQQPIRHRQSIRPRHTIRKSTRTSRGFRPTRHSRCSSSEEHTDRKPLTLPPTERRHLPKLLIKPVLFPPSCLKKSNFRNPPPLSQQ